MAACRGVGSPPVTPSSKSGHSPGVSWVLPWGTCRLGLAVKAHAHKTARSHKQNPLANINVYSCDHGQGLWSDGQWTFS